MQIRSKLPHVGTTIFSVMSALAKEEGALNLSQGFPDFSGSPRLIALVDEHMRRGNNQYAPMPGLPALRERLAEKMQKLYGNAVNPDTDITITAGGTQALYTAINALVHEGDEVILFEPAYDSYAPAVIMAGGKPVFATLEFPDYHINWSQVKKLVSQRTRMIIINTPQNPSGSIWSAKDMKELEKITKGSDIIILSDEVYEHLVFDKAKHESVLSYPSLWERSIAIYSFGKSYHHTGWKIGYAIGPEDLMKEFRKVHQFLVFSVNTPMQYALADYLAESDDYLELSHFYQEKRDLFVKALAASRFQILPSKGTYFQLLGYDKIGDEADTSYAVRLTKEHKIASIPLSVFYHEKTDNKVLRFCFAKSKDTLLKAAEILSKV